MLNRLINLSLNHRAIVLVIAGLLLIAGTIVTFKSEIDIFPDLNSPTVTVMTEAPGFSPEDVEKTVTYPIETALMGAPGMRRVRSTSMPGYSVVWAEFDWNVTNAEARRNVTERLMTVGDALPEGVGSPTPGPQSSILGEILIVGLTSDSLSSMQLRTLADATLAPRLQTVSGVSQVTVIGGKTEEIRIELDPNRMKQLSVGLNEVSEALDQLTSNGGGGVVNANGNEYMVRTCMSETDPRELDKTYVKTTSEGRAVMLADIATVSRGAKEPTVGIGSVGGKDAVLITITKQPGVGTVPLTERLENAVGEARLPQTVSVTTDIYRQSDFIEASVSSLQESLIVGALMVIVVLFFFLMNLRTALISIVVLPLSILITELVLHMLGITINTMTLGGIAIAVGSLVDDAIVDVENVHRRLRERRGSGVSVREIVYEASKEVRVPVFNSSLIIIAGFLPIFFLTGMEGRMMMPLGISFIIALLSSTLVALTVTPVLCLYLLGGSKNTAREDHESPLAKWLRIKYVSLLPGALRHRNILMGTTGVLFVIAIIVLAGMGRSFLPSFNEGAFTINVSALPGVAIEESDNIGRLAEQIILEVPEVTATARKTGRAELDEHSLGSNVSEIEAPYKLNGRTRREVAADIRHRLSHIPGVVVEVGQPVSHRIDAMLSGTEAQLAVKIFGPSTARLGIIARDVKREMEAVDGMVDVNVEQTLGRPQIDIKPKRAMLAHYGITMTDFRRWIETALRGVVLSTVNDGVISRDVTLTVNPSFRGDARTLRDMPVTINSDLSVPLGQIADITSTSGANSISRENALRRLVVSANVEGRDLAGIVAELRERLDKLPMPEGYHIQYGGQFENQERAMNTLMLAAIGALLLIFLLVYTEFRSVRSTAIILINMPLALIGAVLLLWVTYNELNIPAVIGFLSLAGIATRNGMLLMSRYDTLEHSGVSLDNRILTGSGERLNAILMTALTSTLALLPMAVRGHLPGNELQAPIAVAILGGLVTSTLLNLFIVPALYYVSKRNQRYDEKK